MSNVLIIGATSAIAHATARRFAADGARFFLVGRGAERLEAVADDLRALGASDTYTYALDLTDLPAHPAMVAAAVAAISTLDMTLIAHGSLSDQAASEASVERALAEWATNATSVISLLTLLANQLAGQENGTLAVLSSVAGDRARKSLYVYGTAKAALDFFLEGLRGRFTGTAVRVVTIKPGFVDTPMTAHLPKNALFASADRVADDIYRAMQRGTPVVYTPRFWRLIMLAVRLVPGPLLRRLAI